LKTVKGSNKFSKINKIAFISVISIFRMGKNTHYRNMSKPPIAGDPIKTASVTITPKTIPTITKRLFILKTILA